jgi:formamidopyrimidine-DNA glycosylase
VPELPEVETVRRQLAGALIGGCFIAVERVEPAMLRDCTEQQVRELLPGRRVESVGRQGKFLVIALEGGAFLTLHLGMTGHFLVAPVAPQPVGPPASGAQDDSTVSLAAKSPSAHTRFLFALEAADGSLMRLEFRDMRKFGRFHLTLGAPAPRLRALGPDAWTGEWDAAYLAERLRGRKAPVKAFLLDQRHLAGIGNIYADEILWWTLLSPLRPSGSVSAAEVALLAEEIRHRLGEGVRLLGCSFSDFVDTEGRAGGFQDWLRAYGRQGQTCARCGVILVRTVVGGRGTAYCPGCQR